MVGSLRVVINDDHVEIMAEFVFHFPSLLDDLFQFFFLTTKPIQFVGIITDGPSQYQTAMFTL